MKQKRKFAYQRHFSTFLLERLSIRKTSKSQENFDKWIFGPLLNVDLQFHCSIRISFKKPRRAENVKTRAIKIFQKRRDFIPPIDDHRFVVLLQSHSTAATSLFFSLSNCQMSKIRQFLPLIPC